MPKYLKAHDAAIYYGTSIPNLRKWAREGRIDATETPGGHYLYHIPEEDDPISGPDSCEWCPNIIYSRVSSRKQRNDLTRQAMCLKSKYPKYTLIEDIGSGINHKRPGFKAILEQLFKGNIKKVVVTHSDRFSRLGFDFFRWMFEQHGAVLESMDKSERDQREELLDDVMEIFTVFTARYYGSRKYTRDDDGHKKDKDSAVKKTKRTISKVVSGE
jgi:predicted site-specific integrase-resolvase